MPNADRPLRCDVVLEQTLGHVTHGQNLRNLLPQVSGLEPHFEPIEFAPSERWGWVPGAGNWTLRAGLRARRQLRRRWSAAGRPDALFVHTQVPAVLLGRRLSAVPSIVSLDATPLQYDRLGEFYAHDRGGRLVESAKFRLNRDALRRARHVVSWSAWTKESLVDEYGVEPDKISVIAPGVDVERWQPRESRADTGSTVSILFVGGDLHRKGGDLLVDAVRRLRSEQLDVELHLVTGADIDPEPGIVVHRGLGPNSPALIERYHAADIFCLPTLGDCLPMVLAEAAAVGLPLVSTDVGAISELVRHGDNGLLVTAGDGDALLDALRDLVVDPDRRRSFGAAARRVAERDHDAAANAGRIAELLRSVAR